MIASAFGKSPVIPESAWIAPSANVMGNVTLGEHASVWFNCVIRGDVHSISIGAYTNVQDGTVIHVTHDDFATRIGERVTIGHRALLHGCTIGNDCLIGMGCIILDDVEVGDGSVVAAGALLTPGKKFPPGSLILGSPAKVVRAVRPDERAQMIDEGWKNYHGYVQEYRKSFQVLS